MNVAEAIVQEVSCSADLRNGEVIERAFAKRIRLCSLCEYPENAIEYEELLWQYERAKVKAHHAKRDVEKAWSRYLGNVTRISYGIDDGAATRYFQRLIELIASIKAKMKPIRPCYYCKLNYNPTHKPSFDSYTRPKPIPVEEFLNV